MTHAFRIALVLSGGNALGAYQAGVYQALHERGYEPDWVVGASAGAINSVLIAGNTVADRIARLTEFWQPGDADLAGAWWPSSNETIRRTTAVMGTMAGGRPGIFDAVGPLGSWWIADQSTAAPALFDTVPLAATIARLADFDLLNAGNPRFTACAVDLDTGEDARFDTSEQEIAVDHVRASAALLPAFPPVAIGERAFVDGGLSANLPLDPVLEAAAPGEPILCVAVDLLPLAGARPQTLGEAIGRSQDLTLAIQSRRTIERWRIAYAHDPRFAEASVTLLRLAYSDQEAEVAGKGMDYSATSVRHRWSAGHRDATAMLSQVEDGTIAIGDAGLTVHGV